MDRSGTKTVLLSATAMVAFATNSVICRIALEQGAIDAGSFTLVRNFSALICLLGVMSWRGKLASARQYDLLRAAMLAGYMVCFSFAYVALQTGVGALILFGAVQATMMAGAKNRGEQFNVYTYGGFALAALGLVLLLVPGEASADIAGSLMMLVAGVSWGVYSSPARTGSAPLVATTGNFLLATPLTVLLCLPYMAWQGMTLTAQGVVLAAISGVLASALGYVVWHAALQRLSGLQASVMQLSVPVIAGAGGIIWLAEQPSLRFLIASVAVLGGIWIVLKFRPRTPS